jgi:hypothetical protein
MDFIAHRRKPFYVEAAEITEDNLEAAAGLIGDVVVGEDGTRHIKVDKRLVPNIHRAYVGWWVTRMGDNIRCYSPRIFHEQFEVDAPQKLQMEIPPSGDA